MGRFKFLHWILVTAILMTLPIHAKMNFATSADTEHYNWALNLIAGIHRYNFAKLGEIAVFDLGLLPEERAHLESLSGVSVYDVEKTNPVMFQKFVINKKGKIARGWYSWKPVAIKQAMEKFSSFFYLDTGITIQGPLDLLFDHLDQNGYFFIDCGHSIERMTIQPLYARFHLNGPENSWILEGKGISSGIQGLTRALYENYVMPLYALSYDIANFADDSSCPKGYGFARHDQTLFSIQARLLHLQIFEVLQSNKMKLRIDGKTIKTSLNSFFAITRKNFDLERSKQYLIYKSNIIK
jgi:hypothetical protein